MSRAATAHVRCLTTFAAASAGPVSTPHIHLHAPLTPRTLLKIQSLLNGSSAKTSVTRELDHVRQSSTDSEDHATAAVLIPLCNVNGQAGILFQVRGQLLRTHGGQVSFPGGKIDKTDRSPEDAAIRETWEEMGIHSKHIHVLNRMETWKEYSLSGGVRVLPIIGYISSPQESNDSPLEPVPSLEVSSLTLSAAEVAHVFHLPFSDILPTSSRVRRDLFRGIQPYYTVDVSDKIPQLAATDDDTDKRLEVWGLTGWYLSLFMRAMGVW